MIMNSVFTLYRSENLLGESPLWDEERKSCFWVDIERRSFFQYAWQQQQVQKWKLPYRVSLLVHDQDNNLILGLQGGLARFKIASGEFTWLMDLEKQIPANRCNDGQCDPKGRLWVGTMELQCSKGSGALYCIDPGGQAEKKLEGVTISNGIVWSKDHARLYYVDSPTQTIQSFFYDGESGNIRFEKEIVHIDRAMGSPDGMAIDEEGMLWVAHWGGFGVFRWNPFNGKLIGKINLPVPHVTSCAFVGDRLDQLMITSARMDLTVGQLKEYPESGNVFLAEPGCRGVPVCKCGL
jgi:sugar lactone lactonase YvrE